jgi:hypothetical protein
MHSAPAAFIKHNYAASDAALLYANTRLHFIYD